MQNLAKKDCDRPTSQLLHQFNFSKLQKPSLFTNISSGLESAAVVYCHAEDLESQSQSQGQDSHLTLSTCQSCRAMSGRDEVYARQPQSCLRSSLPSENADHAIHQVQLDFSQPTAYISNPWSGSYFGRFIAAYGPKGVIHPQIVSMSSARVPLPGECTESFPLRVNVKQYRAILRRRKIRAKLEAQNKIVKTRKPYLHESRHLHAQKRARGSGGRFLNTKTTPPKHSSPSCVKIKYHQQLSKASCSKIQHSTEQQLETFTLSSSVMTTIFDGYDIFQQPECNTPVSPFHTGATVVVGKGFSPSET